MTYEMPYWKRYYPNSWDEMKKLVLSHMENYKHEILAYRLENTRLLGILDPHGLPTKGSHVAYNVNQISLILKKIANECFPFPFADKCFPFDPKRLDAIEAIAKEICKESTKEDKFPEYYSKSIFNCADLINCAIINYLWDNLPPLTTYLWE